VDYCLFAGRLAIKRPCTQCFIVLLPLITRVQTAHLETNTYIKHVHLL